MRGWRSMARFQRGLVRDRLGVPGALLEADDVVPLPEMSGWRTRGGKAIRAITSAPGAGTYPIFTGGYSAYALTGAQFGDGRILFGGFVGGTYHLAMIDTAFLGYHLPDQALDAAGVPLVFNGRNNIFVDTLSQGVLFDREMLLASFNPFGTPSQQFLPMKLTGVAEAAGVIPSTTGTVSGVAGSNVLTGSGTFWTTVMVGAYIWINAAGGVDDRAYRIVRVDSASQIIVDRPLPAIATNATYRITAMSWWAAKPGTFGVLGQTTSVTSRSTVEAGFVTQHQGRVFGAQTCEAVDNVVYPDRLRWTAVGNENDANFGGVGQWAAAEFWHDNAYIDVFPGQGHTAGGNRGIFALASWNGVLYIFKTAAVYALRGFVETDGRDVGASVDVITRADGMLIPYPVVQEEGVYFAGLDGVYLLNSSGLTNIAEQSGVRDLYREMFRATGGDLSGTAGSLPYQFSIAERRIIISGQPIGDADTAGDPNTLIYDMDRQVWYTETTFSTVRVVDQHETRRALSMVEIGENASVAGGVVDWQDDLMFDAVVTEAARAPKMRVTTHPISIQETGAVNGRVRAMQAKVKLLDPGTADPTLGVSLLLGEQGTNTAVEAAIAAQSVKETGTHTEKWHRMPVRVGAPPVDQVRLRFVQDGASADCRLFEVGVESVPVSRIR